jgi:hypothetical protein
MHEKARADHVFYRSLRKSYPTAVRAEGVFIGNTLGALALGGHTGPATTTWR